MFVENKFYHEYYNIIDKAKKLNRVKNSEVYYESHHIVPRSLGGSDTKDNIILLTAQEHYRVHELLPFFTVKGFRKSMIYAWNLMSRIEDKQIDAELYEKLRIAHSKNMSGSNNPVHNLKDRNKWLINKSRASKGSQNGNFGNPSNYTMDSSLKEKLREINTGKIRSKEHRSAISKSKLGKPRKQLKCPHCDKIGGDGNMQRWHFDNCKSL